MERAGYRRLTPQPEVVPMKALSPWRLPRYSSRRLELHRLLASRLAQMALDVDGNRLTFRAAPAPDATGSYLQLALYAGGSRLWLGVGRGTLAELCAPWGNNGIANDLPPTLHEAVLNAAVGPLIDAVNSLFGLGAVMTGEEAKPPEDSIPVGLMREQSPNGPPGALLHLDDTTADAVIAALEVMPAAQNGIDWSDLLFGLTLDIGHIPLQSGELRQLGRGDILLFQSGSPAPESRIMLKQGTRPLAAAHLEGTRLTIDPMPENAMSENDQADATDTPEGAAVDPDQLEVRLDFDLGQLSLKLSELKNIVPGHVFELDAPLATVRIRAGRQLIGRGELVDIDGRTGVKVTILFAPTDE